MTCASCHPEGNDDGHTWNFSDVGPRRTPMLRGGLPGTEPFHWSGDLRDFGHLVDAVLTRRLPGALAAGPALARAVPSRRLRAHASRPLRRLRRR